MTDLVGLMKSAGRRASSLESTTRDADVRRILAVAKVVSGVDVAWVSRFDGEEQLLAQVEAAPEGRLPLAQTPVNGADAGMSFVRVDGSVRGMLRVTSPATMSELGEERQRYLRFLADLITALLEGPADSARRDAVAAAIAGSGRSHVLQPIVDVRTGVAVGVEALARFDEPPFRPDLWFAEAEELGLLHPLEVAAAASGLSSLADRDGYVSINLSPSTIVAGELDDLLIGVDQSRVVVEITEHAQVDGYDALRSALASHRRAGLRLAIDDAGAGHSNFRHILQLQPDYIKVDLSLVRDVHLDPARQALTASLLSFARTTGAQVIAEGVETQDELDTLARLGVTLMQGYLLARPTAAPPTDGFATTSRHVLVNGASDLSLILADAVRHGGDLEQVVRPLLDSILALTGLETSYVTLLHGDEMEHRFVRNAGRIELPEGLCVPWSQSLCSSMQAQQLSWTNNVARDLADRPLAAANELQTYLTTPLRSSDGTILGTVCAGSTRSLYISDAAIAQIQLIAHVISAELNKVPETQN